MSSVLAACAVITHAAIMRTVKMPLNIRHGIIAAEGERMRVVMMLALMAQTLSAQPLPGVRAAITKALPVLQRSAGEFVSRRACVSCHHNILPILTLHLAQ